MIVIYNPKRGVPVTDWFQQDKYAIGVNEMQKFQPMVADYLLGKFGFLRRIEPENILQTKEEMKVLPFKCEYCKDEFATEKKLVAHHASKHKLTKEAEDALGSIPSAGPVAKVQLDEKNLPMSPEDIDKSEGVLSAGKKDRHGVEWYGDGLQVDRNPRASMTTRRPGIDKGVFGAN